MMWYIYMYVYVIYNIYIIYIYSHVWNACQNDPSLVFRFCNRLPVAGKRHHGCQQLLACKRQDLNCDSALLQGCEHWRHAKAENRWYLDVLDSYRSSRLGQAVFFQKSLSYGHGWLLFPVRKETNKPENQLAMDEGETGTKKQMHEGESPARKKE